MEPGLMAVTWYAGDPWIAIGFVLALIPIILHILERRRTPVVDWPAMRFFLPGLKRRVRWMRIREVLLIALRSGLIVAVVAAFIRPGMTREGPAGGRAAGRGVVILLDNSSSMGARSAEGQGRSRWDAARAAAIETIDGLAPGDPVLVATLAGKPASLSAGPIRNPADARAAVREAALAGGNASIPAGLDLAADLARTLPAPRREVLIIADLQERGWSLRDEVRWGFVLGRLASLSPAPSIAVIDVGEEKAANRALLDLATSRPIAGIDRPVEIIARAAVLGDPSPRSLEIALRVDGEERESRTVQVSGGFPAAVRFRHRFASPGPHRAEALLRGPGDGFPDDDVRRLAVRVEEKVEVLIVAGDAGNPTGDEGLGGDGEFLDLALAPRARGLPAPEVLFRPTVIGPAAFEDLRAADLARYRLVVLADVRALDPGSARLLEDYVRAGGGLLVFAGEKAIPEAYASGLFRDGRGVLPAPILEREGDGAAPGGPISPGGFVEGHPAFAEVGEALRELGEVRARRWWRTGPLAPGAARIAELKPGTPYLLEKALGRGRSVLAVTSARLDDSDLPRRPIFVPLIHGLAGRLAAGSEDPKNLLLGDPVVLRSDSGSRTAVVEHPTLGPRPAAIEAVREEEAGLGAGAVVRWGPTDVPGFYPVTIRTAAGERKELFAVNTDPRESDPMRLPPGDIDRLARMGIPVVRGASEVRPEPASLTVREEWWRPILAVAIGLLVLEVLATRALAGGRAPWRPPERRGA